MLTYILVALQPPPTQRRRKSRRNSTRSLRNAPGPLTRQLSANSLNNNGAPLSGQEGHRSHRRQPSEGSASDADTASLASGDSGECITQNEHDSDKDHNSIDQNC